MSIMTEAIRRTHPGVILKHSIESLEMSSKEFSYRTGISERTLSDLINKKGSITFDIAEKLSIFFGNDIRFWTNLQTQYFLSLSLENYQNEIEQDYYRIKPLMSYWEYGVDKKGNYTGEAPRAIKTEVLRKYMP